MGYSFVNSTSSPKESVGFHFSNRRVPVDWRKLASIDLQRISRELDFEALQNNIFHITFCDINAEFDRDIDENFVKLFRLAQMIIEYLLYSQEQLAKSVTSLEEKLKYTIEGMEKSKVEHAEIRHKKSNKAQMVYIAKEAHKCLFCSKAFLNDHYLQMHMQRRHNSAVEVKVTRDDKTVSWQETQETKPVKEAEINEINLVMKEIKELKEGLEKKDGKISEERLHLTAQIKSDLEDIAKREVELRKETQVWKLEQVDANKKELGGLCDIMMKELHNVQERLQKLNVQNENKSNVGLLIDEDEINAELLKRQQDAWQQVQMQLQQQFQQIEKQMQLSLQEQEERIGQKFSHLMQQNYQKLDNIYDTWKHSTPNEDAKVMQISAATETHVPEMKDKCISVTDGTLNTEKITEKLQPNFHLKDAFATEVQEKVKKTKKRTKKSFVIQRDVNNRPIPIDKELISGLREEVVDLLQERLSDLGIQQHEKGLSDEDLASKIQLQKRDLQFLSKKYPGFSKFRQQIQSKMDKMLSTSPRLEMPKTPRKSVPKMKLDNTFPASTPIPAPRKIIHSSGGKTMDFSSSGNVFQEVQFLRSNYIGNAIQDSEAATNSTVILHNKPPLAEKSNFSNPEDKIPTTKASTVLSNTAPEKPLRTNLMVPAHESTDEESQSDLEEILKRISASPTKILGMGTGTGNAKDEISSNTAGTSVWTSSASAGKTNNTPIGNSAASATSWDSSEDDISEIKMP